MKTHYIVEPLHKKDSKGNAYTLKQIYYENDDDTISEIIKTHKAPGFKVHKLQNWEECDVDVKVFKITSEEI